MTDSDSVDVTEIVLRYRVILHDLWNTHCFGNPDLRTTEFMHNFEALKRPLFQFFVWDNIGPRRRPGDGIFGPDFLVVPAKAGIGGKEIISSLLVDMSPPERAGGNWRELNGEFYANDLQLHLLDFFDWRLFYWRDYRYFRVRIDGFASYPDLVGRDALVDVFDVAVLFGGAEEAVAE